MHTHHGDVMLSALTPQWCPKDKSHPQNCSCQDAVWQRCKRPTLTVLIIPAQPDSGEYEIAADIYK